MPLNTSPVRRDIDYLRRRVKPRPEPVAEAAPAAAAAPASAPTAPPAATAPSTGLTLGGPSSPAPSSPAPPAPTPSSAPSTGLTLGGGSSSAPATASARPAAPAAPSTPQPFPAPTAEEVRVLDDETPLVRLDPRQSAIGSLIVGGATAIVWETVDRVTGVASADGGADGTPVTTPGNRPLLGFDGGDAILALRHVHLIRRALFVGAPGQPLTVQLFDDENFAAADEAGGVPVVSLLRLGSRLELRLEPLPADIPLKTLVRQFGFEPTPYVVGREPRRR